MRRSQTLGPYRLLYRVASGGMAEIYRGERVGADGRGESVAIKRLLPTYNQDDEFILMIKDEARLMARLDHPNIARVHQLSEDDEQHYLVMEYIDGVDLRTLLRRCRDRDARLPVESAVYIVEQALRGLHFAHEARGEDGTPLGIVHRDISPSNILVGVDGAIKLIDFGIAKANLSRTRTRGGVIKGKVKYMSPEQTVGKRLDRRSDVFAAGVVLYHAITGALPFHAPDDALLMTAIREQEPDPPSRHGDGVDEALDAIVGQALRKAPGARFSTAEAFAEALRAWREARGRALEPAHLGATVAALFASDRQDEQSLYDEFSDASDGRTPSGVQVHYTRVVEPEACEVSAPPDPIAELDAWLAARRGARAEPLDSVWSADERPGWVDGLGGPSRTAEHEARDTEGGGDLDTATDASIGSGERPI